MFASRAGFQYVEAHMFIDSQGRRAGYVTARTHLATRASTRFEPLEHRRLFSTYTVNTLADDLVPGNGRLSLREAVAAAGAHAGADTVSFASGLTGTLRLAAGPMSIGDPSLTINGPGAARLSVSGENASRVFQLDPASNVRLSGLTITAGNADTGGGIYALGGSLTVTGTKFLANHADGLGGAIHVGGPGDGEATILTLTNCTFDANTANEGGAVSSASFSTPALPTLTITNSTFRNNAALANGGALSGGGNVSGSTFTANTAGSGGGAMWQRYAAGDVAATDCTFASNSAVVGGAFGQAFDANASTFTRCTFRDNHALAGGAASYVFSTTPRIAGCTFDDNAATYGGGAITTNQISRLSVENTTFTNNSAGAGGAMNLRATSGTLKNVSFVGNQAIGGDGGALCLLTNASLAITGSQFRNNTARGLDGTPNPDGTANDGAAAAGGAIALEIEASSATITRSTFIGNAAVGGDGGPAAGGNTGGAGGNASGGAIFDGGNGTGVSLADSTLTNNRAVGGRGGGGAGVGGAGGRGGDATGGGVARLPQSQNRSISNTTFAANLALGGAGGDAVGGTGGGGGDARGGGLADAGGPDYLTASTLKTNLARGGDAGNLDAPSAGRGGSAFGGAVFLPDVDEGSPAAFFISGSTMADNLVLGGRGSPAGDAQGPGLYSAGEPVFSDAATTVKRSRTTAAVGRLRGLFADLAIGG